MAGGAGELHLRLGVGFGGVVEGPDGFERGIEFQGEVEAARDGLHGAVAGEVGGMVERVGRADADAGGGRQGDAGEKVGGAALAVGGGDGLEGGRADREEQIIAAGGHALGDGLRDGHVALGVEVGEVVGVLGPAALCHSVEHALTELVEDHLRGMLEEGDAGFVSRERRAGSREPGG